MSYLKMQDRGAYSHSHPTNQEASSEFDMFDENPWGVGMLKTST
jgi:hypothetical protein